MAKPYRIYLEGGDLDPKGREKMPSEVKSEIYYQHSAFPPYCQKFVKTDELRKSGDGRVMPVYKHEV